MISGSIVTGSCDLQVLDYNMTNGETNIVMIFDVVDESLLEKSLFETNKNIATNTAIIASGQSVSPGALGKFRDHPKVSLLGAVALLGDCTFIPADCREVGRAPLIHFQKISFKKGFFRSKLARELKFYTWINIE